MIKIIIFEKGNQIVGWQIKGHSGYAEAGADIVCASVSTATELVLGAMQEAGQNLKSEIHDGFMSVQLLGEVSEVQTTLIAMKKFLENIAKNYAKYVKLEVKEDVF